MCVCVQQSVREREKEANPDHDKNSLKCQVFKIDIYTSSDGWFVRI